MSHTYTVLPLPSVAPGTRRQLGVHRYGTPGARPRVYLQAALHADEHPGLLVARHLLARLNALATAGRIRGEIVLVPVANPIGLAQRVFAAQPGRYDLETGGNFNRDFPDLGPALVERLQGRLGDDAEANAARVRATLAELVAGLTAEREVEHLQHALLGLAIEADYVLDLHCDGEALLHLYTERRHAATGAALAADLGAAVLMLEDAAGGQPFDAACAQPWSALAAVTDAPLGPGCIAVTVELRGQPDVCDALAAADAEGLERFLVRCGALEGDGTPAAAPATPTLTVALDAVDVPRTPGAGLVVFKRWLGDTVERGELVAEVVDLDAADPAGERTPIHTGTRGLLFAVEPVNRLVRPGQKICMIAGTEPLAYRQPGTLLAD